MAPFAIATASTSAIERSDTTVASEELIQRRSQRQLDRNHSANSSNWSLKAHHHLGLRPKASDSLHTRLRKSNPAPKHISKIEDVTATSLLKAPLGFKREGSNDSRLMGDGKRLLSKKSEADKSMEGFSDRNGDLGDLGDHQEITTDIGIYDESVYDEYLGPMMGSLRRRLIKSLHWESPLLARHQALVRTPRLDKYFVYTSLLGTHSFFLIFLPMAFWIGNARFARGLVNVLAFGVYTSSAVKDALCIPRPISPPVTRLVVGTTHLEYGFLSTHSTNSVSIAMYLYLWLRHMRAGGLLPSYMDSPICEVALLYYAGSVVYGRIYCGMHSLMDCVMGSALGAAISLTQWYLFDYIEELTLSGGWTVPIVIVTVGLLMVIVHPQPLDDCPCFEDAIAFLSVVMGVVTARWANVRYALLPRDDNPFGKIVRPMSSTLRRKLNNKSTEASISLSLSTLLTIISKTSKMAFGVVVILAVRLIVKTICRVILPPIFRFAQGTFGLVLPRRHYRQTIGNINIQSSPRRPNHKRKSSSAGGDFFSDQSDPKQYDASHWKLDTRSTIQQNQDREQAQSQSQTDRPIRAERNKVKFTLGDYKDIPVPFTHPNTHLPGDGISERVAGALSMDEKKRQRQEFEKNFQFPSRQDNGALIDGRAGSLRDEEEEFAHYDIDVLTKVFVYHSIGFVTSCCLPALFVKWNWS